MLVDNMQQSELRGPLIVYNIFSAKHLKIETMKWAIRKAQEQIQNGGKTNNKICAVMIYFLVS